VNEALRLYPPGWLLSRRTVQPDVLSGYQIPAGANVLLPLYLLHRHPRYWKDPDTFFPERFAPDHDAERPRFAYMPFAAGPRHCIGETFALYEMLLDLHRIARHFRLVHVPDKPLQGDEHSNLRALRSADVPGPQRTAFPARPRARQAHRARGADQPSDPLSPAHEAGTPLMSNPTTLTELIEANRNHSGKVTYLEGEHDAHDVSFEELHARA